MPCTGADPRDADAIASLSSVKTRLAPGAASAFISNILGTGMAFLSHLVLARALSAQGYGVCAYVMAWITVLALLALGQVGLNAALIPTIGMESAAVATTIALISWNTAMAVLVWKNLHIMPSLLARR